LNPDSCKEDKEIEQFCNRVAAEFLVPGAILRSAWSTVDEGARYERFASRFKVSRIVVARRALDLRLISREEFFRFYREWQDEERPETRASGGSFWNNQNVRVGERFGLAVVRAAAEGRLMYRDAYALTGLRAKTYRKFAHQLEVDP